MHDDSSRFRYSTGYVFIQNSSLDRFCAFLLEHSLTSHVTFSRFGSSFLSDFFCSHSEVKLVAYIKSVAAKQK